MTESIVVETLSKEYTIGSLHRESMFVDRLMTFLKRPLHRNQSSDNTVWALRNVSFTVGVGEVVGIIGRNGAGKSTLLKLLSKITYPTSGTVTTHGQVASLLEVGTGFHEELTGRENIYLNGSILGMTKKKLNARLDAIVDFADVGKFIDTPIKHFSSGMRLRLGFAVAAHLEPHVLLVDEVLAVGDVEFQKKCLRAMDDLGTGGRTVLFVSHNLAAVENLCSRTIWIDNGQVRQDGNSREVIETYLSTFAGGRETGSDLRHLETRRGNGEIRYTGIEFHNHDGKPLKVIRSGDNLIVRLYYHAEKDVSNLVVFGFRIFTELGTLITDVSTGNTGTAISRLAAGDGYIEVAIDFLNLMPARYYLSLWLHNDRSLLYDVLEHCAALDVEPSNFYKSGKGIDSRLGLIFLPYKWNLAGLSDGAKFETPISRVNS